MSDTSFKRFAFYDVCWCDGVEEAEICKDCKRNRQRVTNWNPPGAYTRFMLSKQTYQAAIDGRCSMRAPDDNSDPIVAP